jgi:hypothetical protein
LTSINVPAAGMFPALPDCVVGDRDDRPADYLHKPIPIPLQSPASQNPHHD